MALPRRGLGLLVLCGALRSSGGTPNDRSEPRVNASAESGCCGPPGLVCSGANFSGVVEETLYFAHPRSTGGSFDWGNHNMADALGEAVRHPLLRTLRPRSSCLDRSCLLTAHRQWLMSWLLPLRCCRCRCRCQAFLCVDGSFVTRFNDSLISTVRMRWNASYANYAECDDIEGGES